jgi:hypothetical protein
MYRRFLSALLPYETQPGECCRLEVWFQKSLRATDLRCVQYLLDDHDE